MLDLSQADAIKRRGRELGFAQVGITDASPFPDDEQRSLDWLDAGHQAGLGWMTPERQQRACRPAELLDGARSLIVVGASYADPTGGPVSELSNVDADADAPARGRVARYARGTDYHDVMKVRLRKLADFVETLEVPAASLDDGSIRTRVFVDASPLVERAAAVRAGLGFIGKNTNLLTADAGSWLLLGAVLTTLPLQSDAPTVRDCGQCRLCLDACPTGALPAPFVLDANRCISYLTIEHKGSIPRDLRHGMSTHVFGCDVCQDVCPWNRRTRVPAWPVFADTESTGAPVLSDVLRLDDEAFRARYRSSPISRTKRRGLLRNAAIAAGNAGDQRDVPALIDALGDAEPLVRGHAAWALGQIGGDAACDALRAAQPAEHDASVLNEIDAALNTSAALL